VSVGQAAIKNVFTYKYVGLFLKIFFTKEMKLSSKEGGSKNGG